MCFCELVVESIVYSYEKKKIYLILVLGFYTSLYKKKNLVLGSIKIRQIKPDMNNITCYIVLLI